MKPSATLSLFLKFLTTLIASRIIQAENDRRSTNKIVNIQFRDFINSFKLITIAVDVIIIRNIIGIRVNRIFLPFLYR